MTADRASFDVIVRRDGRWRRTEATGDADVEIDLAALISLVQRSGAPSDPTEDGAVVYEPFGPDVIVEPAWIVTGLVCSGGVSIGSHQGLSHLLDLDDLRLLDAVRGPTPVHSIEFDSGVNPAGARLARLVALGAAAVPSQVERPVERAGQPAPTAAPFTPVAPSGGPHPGGPPGRIPVYAMWHEQVGPLLSLGMLTAAARHHDGGALNHTYEIRRPEGAESVLADLATRTGPAVLLSSDYVWSIRENLDAAQAALALNPDLVVIHGGPSCPKYEGEAEAFLDEHGPIAHILCRGEGEHLITELLEALAPTEDAPGRLTFDPDALGQLDGITFRHPGTGTTIRTADRPRITDLDALPSPYLTGEFDHIGAGNWNTCLAVETNRGCPYSCTFCDWGSATLSRIRKFSLDRVEAEVEWAAVRGVQAVNLPDANFGIMSRDVETTRRIAAIKARVGHPTVLVFYPAKNTTKHFLRIMDILGEASISCAASLSLQTTDEATLEALDRSNISTDHFVALAADYRRRGHPLQGDLLVGIPGQTYESYRRDLQFMFDQEILVRTWPVQILPNAPMNDPEYRARHGIVSDADNLIQAASTFTPEDRAHMLRLRRVDLIAERYGVLRHVLRWLQWDHGIEATTVMDQLVTQLDVDPGAYPHLSWVLSRFPEHATAPRGWADVMADVRRFVADRFGIGPSTALDTVTALNQFLLPARGRTFPATIELAHDYLAYYRSAVSDLFTSGHAGTPPLRLEDHPPASFTVEADPLGLCDGGLHFQGDSRNEVLQGEFQIGSSAAHELLSPLVRILPGVGALGISVPWMPADPHQHDLPTYVQDVALEDGDVRPGAPVPVTLGSRP